MGRRLLLCAFVMATAACEKSAAVGGVVVDPAGTPVGGATVSFSCPDHGFGDGDQVVTDATGKFVHHNIPDIAETCTLMVEKAGFVPKTLQRKDVAYASRTSALGLLPKVQLERAK